MLANPALKEDVLFVDVREPGEEALAKVPGFTLFPLSQGRAWLPTFLAEHARNKEIVGKSTD
jgi:rhodanese-related sulfurtransferase